LIGATMRFASSLQALSLIHPFDVAQVPQPAGRALVAQERGPIDEVDLELAEWPPDPIRPGLLECEAGRWGVRQ
jgi:hypothetical protein